MPSYVNGFQHYSLIRCLSRVQPLMRHQGELRLHPLAAVGARELALLVLQHVRLQFVLLDEDAAVRALNLFFRSFSFSPLDHAGDAFRDVLWKDSHMTFAKEGLEGVPKKVTLHGSLQVYEE